MSTFARGLFVACALGLFGSTHAVASDKAEPVAPFLKGDVEAGGTKAATCAACHGPGGNSANPICPSLAGQGAPYIYAQLKAFKKGMGGGQSEQDKAEMRMDPVMSAQAMSLSDQDMQDLAVFFAAQSPKPGVASEDSVAIAQPLYRAGDAERGVPACASCHGPTGAGNPAAGYPRIGAQQADYTAKQLKAYRSGERKAGAHGLIMAEVAAKLSDEEIAALASYLNGLQ